MKDSVFVWTPVLVFAIVLILPLFIDVAVPYTGAIYFLGCSVSGYVGMKSVGIYTTSKELPSGEGVSPEIMQRYRTILVALYILIVEAVIVKGLSPLQDIPFDELFIMAGVCSFFVISGNQALKMGEKLGPRSRTEA
ncbi:MAG: hypothetical protein PQJ59_17025 [Spirochaetales bacterium]|nr:hypothetical protein [Spirochaetales bacterium]